MLRTALVRGAFEYQGQKCSAASRAYVAKSVWAKMRDESWPRSRASDDGRRHRPVELHGRGDRRPRLRQAQGAIDRAKRDSHLSILAGGQTDDSVGYFVRPTVVESTDPEDEIFTTEYFGPILAVHVYDDAATTGCSRRWSRSRRTR